MSVLIRTVVALPLLMFLVIVGWMSVLVVDPIAAVVLDNDAVHSVGFAEPIITMISLGLRFVLPGIGLAVIVWWVFGTIRTDQRQTTVRR